MTGATLGAAFLMATSAIGPGFLTQTTVFTVSLGTSFGFVILLSLLLDLGAQVNIWRVVVASGRRAPELAGAVFPGLGHVLTVLIVLGGLAFNIGNVAGAGLGLDALAGVPVVWGAGISGALSAMLFMSREAGKTMDRVARALGFLMILLTGWVAVSAHPPVLQALKHTFWPEKIDMLAVLTIVGGTVGGYISFAGAHRLLAAGIKGNSHVPLATKSAFTGIGVATLMRGLLFLAAIGVVAGGAAIDPANPPASIFAVAGEAGYRFFGLVMWSAAVTSVLGCSFTSVSFLTASFPALLKYEKPLLLGFILFSTLAFAAFGKPVQALIIAGALNGLILPLALAALLLAARKPLLTGDYRPSSFWLLAGWLVVLVMGAMAVVAMKTLMQG
ncbi:MAG: divalent metal cation transporter [Lewinellaceae bacterium]|nr:divalent metal cation transporter [Lewinellaceae bacterium]